MKNKASKQKSKRKGNVGAFGCDLTEHLQNSGQDVPQVLKTCAEFIEKHGIVDGIYRLSGITSNIQRLRQEYSSELCPELTREVYLQDIHCVGSLCKLYFRELPNPLLTYELYKKFMDAVSIKEEHEQLQYIQDVIKELPPPHYRTLEYLTKHLVHMASFRSQTNMHARNLALVWAPNLLRSKEIELPTCNGDMAFLEVRVQQTVVEFILNHVEQIFNYRAGSSSPKEGLSLVCEAKSATLPASSHCAPMKLMSLEEAQSRSLDQKHPIHRNRQRENSLPDTSTAALYQTVIDLPDSKRMFSGKSKKWKSIFNLGRSVTDSKGKLSRNGSVFVKAQKISEKAPIRPTKSMDSLCSLSMEDIESEFRQSSGENDFFMPAFKSCTLISGNTSSQSEKEPEMLLGAMGGSPSTSRAARKSGTTPLQKALPEQMKVFKSDNNNCQPTSPKNRRMLYTSTNNDSSKLAFPGSLFPLESTPRHHHKALNISEPFAVSVPLRVSAVISSNSTPCRAPDKQEAALLPLKPSREAPLAHQGCSGSSKSACSDDRSCNEIPLGKEDWQSKAKSSRACTAFKPAEGQKEYHGMVSFNTREEVEQLSEPLHSPYQHSMKPVSSTISRDAEARLDILTPGQVSSPHAAESAKPQKQLENRLKQHYELGELTQLDKTLVKQEELWPIDHLDLKIIEPDVIDDTFELNCPSTNYTTNSVQLKAETHGKRRSSFPTYPVLNTDNSTLTAKKPLADHHTRNAHHLSLRDIPERGLSLNVSQKSDVKQGSENKDLAEPTVAAGTKSLLPLDQCTSTQKESFHVIQSQPIPPKLRESTLDLSQQSQVRTKGHSDSMTGDSIVKNELCDSVPEGLKALGKCDKQDTKGAIFSGEKDQHVDFRRSIVRFPKPMLERPKSLELPDKDDENAWGNNSEDLEQVEPWEDFSTTKQWVTSPLHSPKTFDFLLKAEELSSCSVVESSKGKEVVGDSHPNMRSVLSLGKDIQPCHDVKGNNTDNLQTQENKSTEIFEETTKSLRSLNSAPKGKVNPSSLQPHKQKSQNTFDFEKIKEHTPLKHQRPYSLNLDLGIAYVIETSGQHQFPDVSSTKRGAMASPETKHSCSSVQLEMFLADRQAAMRRNSAPVSVSSIRTAFVTKTCQAKSVPVIPPKIQFSLVPQPLQVKNSEPSLEKERENMFVSRINEVLDPLPALTSVKYPKEEMENNKPVSKTPRHVRACSSLEMCKATLPTDQPVLRRKRNSNGEASVNDSRFEKSTIVQRQSFRTRPNRPQSLILFSPPFPIMDYPPLGDDAKLPLSHIKNDTETSTSPLAFNEEVDENVTNPDGVTSQNKMAMPKSGQRLETSMSCFYQPQRRSMIFDSRSNRQID